MMLVKNGDFSNRWLQVKSMNCELKAYVGSIPEVYFNEEGKFWEETGLDGWLNAFHTQVRTRDDRTEKLGLMLAYNPI